MVYLLDYPLSGLPLEPRYPDNQGSTVFTTLSDGYEVIIGGTKL